MKLCILIFSMLLTCNSVAETLNQWLALQLRKDEQILSDSLSQVNGYTFDMLKESKYYIPFFLELPRGFTFTYPAQKVSFDAWIKETTPRTLLGGYIFRLKFKTAPPLYAVSAGDWGGNTWHCLALGKDIAIEPDQTWERANSEHLYATLIAGKKPRLIVYDKSAEIAQQVSFEASAVDFEQRLQTAITTYSSGGKPIIEMISLFEYLKQPDAIWRSVDMSGKFNLRNQHERSEEQERLKTMAYLSRTAAVSALLGDVGSAPQLVPAVKTPPTTQPSQKITEVKPKFRHSLSEKPASSILWSAIAILIVATLAVFGLLLKKRK